MKKIMLVILVLLSSCSYSVREFDVEGQNVSYQDIFNVNYNKYIVLLYKTNCIPSRNTLMLIQEDYSKYPIEVCLVETNTNGIVFDSISKDNVGVTSYQDISISKVPTLFIIEKGRIEYELIGFEQIRDNYLSFYFK